jgi:hypothetical protein
MKPVKNLLLPMVMLLLFACRKESFTNSSSARLISSQDTLHFDTVFTTTGSISQLVKVKNENNKSIHIASVHLAGGSSSPFAINVDGVQGPLVNDVDIAANDSVYIFVTVHINPSAAALPFLVRDSIELDYNNNRQFIQLDAFGMNAHFFRNRTITASETWNNDLPYVILGGLTVDSNASLTINKGCRIFMHADAPFIVNGTLLVNGESPDSARVVFSGDRIDDPYRDFPGSYPGLVFTTSSRNSVINYGIIKNAYQGIVAIDPSPSTKLVLNETIIDNAYDIGLAGINTGINARNLLISNCGKNLVLLKGGDYNFIHCTIAAVSNNFIQHKDPVFQLTNFLNQGNAVVTSGLNAVFRNCIFWGENNGIVPTEVVVSRQGNSSFNVLFEKVLWRVKNAPGECTVQGEINGDPAFERTNGGQTGFSFRLRPTSPAINKGVASSVNLDLDGYPRPVGLPDLGAYERQQ